MRDLDKNFMKLFILSTHLMRGDVCLKYQKNNFLHFSDYSVILFDEGNGRTFNYLFPFIINEMPVLYSQ